MEKKRESKQARGKVFPEVETMKANLVRTVGISRRVKVKSYQHF